MSVTIDGTSGVTTPATASDSYTGPISVSASAPDNSVVVDASGKMGIGTSSPSQLLTVGGGSVRGQVNVLGNNGTSPTVTLDHTATASGRKYILYSGGSAAGNFDIYDATAAAFRATIDSSGNLLVGTTTSVGGERLNATKDLSGQEVVRFYNSNATNPYGVLVNFSGGTFNNATNYFFLGLDGATPRIYLRSNGGIANYSANNVNLSDARLKRDFTPAQPWLEKLCQIEVGTFFYKDQTDDVPNLGVLAQQVEAVAPELVDASGFGTAPKGEEPYKAIYQTDLQYALLKAIQELKAIVDQQAIEIANLKGQA